MDDRVPPGGTPFPVDVEHRERQGRAPGPTGPGGWGAGPGGAGAVRYSIQPPWEVRPPGATDFQLASTIQAADNANTPAFFTTESTLPSGNVGVIRSLSLLANNLLVTSDIRWALFYDESPVAGWNDLTVNPRAAGSVESSFTANETYIPVDEAARIRVRVAVIDGGTYQVSVNLHGWFYSQELERAARASYGYA